MIPRFLIAALLVPSAAFAYGEDDGAGRYSVEERALHFHTDRLRIEPGATDPTFEAEYEPVLPLVYNADLNDAARFYAEDMEENGCWNADHSSCDGTSFGERLAGFYTGGLVGENIAMGGMDPEDAVFEVWLYSPGHRENMLTAGYEELGTGFAGTPFSSSWWVQDFGSRGGTPIPYVTSATHDPVYPQPAETVRFYAAVHDPAGLPAGVSVMVDGLCYEMTPERGFGGTRSYVATVAGGTEGCLPYVIAGTAIDGTEFTYPDTGSLLASIGEVPCETWTEERADSECLPNGEAGVAGFGASGTGCGGGGGPDDNVGEDVEYGTCSVGARPGGGAPWMLCVVLISAAIRRRRR